MMMQNKFVSLKVMEFLDTLREAVKNVLAEFVR